MSRALGLLLALLTLTGSLLFALEQKQEPELTKEEQQKLAAEVQRLSEEVPRLYRAARFPEAEAKMRKILALNRRRYPLHQFPDGHPAMSTGLNSLAQVLWAQGKLAQAEPLYRQA